VTNSVAPSSGSQPSARLAAICACIATMFLDRYVENVPATAAVALDVLTSSVICSCSPLLKNDRLRCYPPGARARLF